MRFNEVDNRLEVEISCLNYYYHCKRILFRSRFVYFLRGFEVILGDSRGHAREIPLVSKCVRLIGRRGTRARISRVHSRLPRIITHAWICRRLLRPPPRHTASPPRTQAVCGRRNCIPLFFLVFPWNLQVTAKVVDRRHLEVAAMEIFRVIRYASLKKRRMTLNNWPNWFSMKNNWIKLKIQNAKSTRLKMTMDS